MLSITIVSICIPIAVIVAIRGLAFGGEVHRVKAPSVALAAGGLLFTAALGELPSLVRSLLSWNPSFTVVLVAYGFIDLARTRGLVEALADAAARIVPRGSPHAAIAITVVAAFGVNAIVLSASSTCFLLAPVFMPILGRLGIRASVAAAALLLGAWGGFLNSADTGASALNAVLGRGAEYSTLSHIVAAAVGLGLGTVTLVATLPPIVPLPCPEAVGPRRPLNPRGFIVVLPIALVVVAQIIAYVDSWQINAQDLLQLSMLISIIAMLVTNLSGQARPASASHAGSGDLRVLLAGAKRGLVDVVLLIVAAKIFVYPYTLIDGPDLLTRHPFWLLATVPVAFALAALVGSGDAVVSSMVHLATQSVVVPASTLGSMIWLACELGRNVSPIAPATRFVADQASGGVAGSVAPGGVARLVFGPALAALCGGCAALWLMRSVC
jgi:C4-dicarboxylate transporter